MSRAIWTFDRLVTISRADAGGRSPRDDVGLVRGAERGAGKGEHREGALGSHFKL